MSEAGWGLKKVVSLSAPSLLLGQQDVHGHFKFSAHDNRRELLSSQVGTVIGVRPIEAEVHDEDEGIGLTANLNVGAILHAGQNVCLYTEDDHSGHRCLHAELNTTLFIGTDIGPTVMWLKDDTKVILSPRFSYTAYYPLFSNKTEVWPDIDYLGRGITLMAGGVWKHFLFNAEAMYPMDPEKSPMNYGARFMMVGGVVW